MKLLFTFLLSFVVALGYAQNVPQKKDATITLQTGLSKEEAFVKWGKHLAQNGYSIAESNKDFLTLSTGPKDTSKWNYDFTVHSAVTDNGSIVLKLKWRQKASLIADTSAGQYYDWSYKGKNDIFFQDIMQVVEVLGYPVAFSR